MVDWRIGIKGMLKTRAEQDPRIVAKNVLGPVPVMDVEVEDGHPLHVMNRQRVRRSTGNVSFVLPETIARAGSCHHSKADII